MKTTSGLAAFPAGDLNIFFINYDGHFHDLLNDLDKELVFVAES